MKSWNNFIDSLPMNLDLKVFPNPEPFFKFSKVFWNYHLPICLSCLRQSTFMNLYLILSLDILSKVTRVQLYNIRICFPICLIGKHMWALQGDKKKMQFVTKWFFNATYIMTFNTCNYHNMLLGIMTHILLSFFFFFWLFLKFILQIIL